MAIIVNKGTFAKSTGGAPVAQTIDTGSGVEIKFLKLFGVKAPAVGFASQDVSGSHGFSDGTTEKAVGYFSDNITLNRSITSSCSGDKILCFVDGTETITAEADVTFGTGIDAGKFTVTWTTNDADADIIHFEAYTGDSITDVKVGEFSSNIVTGNQAVTGVGFQGEYLSLMSASNVATTMTAVHSRIAFGQAISSSARNTWGFMLRDNQNANKDSDVQLTDACLATLEAGGMQSGEIDGEWDFVSFDADGFTLNVVNAPDLADKIFYAVLNGGEYDVGSFNQPTSTGTDTVTVGFIPKGISLSSWNKVADIVPAVDSSPIKGSYGAGTSSAEGGIWWEHDNKGDAVEQDEDINTYTDKVIKLASGPSTIDAEADFDSTTATAFVLNWTTADATAREILYFAIGQLADTFDEDFTVDAILKATQTFNFTVDPLLKGAVTKFFLIDAFTQDVFDEDFTVDAKIAFRETFDVDARLVNRIDEDFIVDAFPQAETDKTFLVDARLSALAEFGIDGLIVTDQMKDFLIDLFVQELNQEETFLVDAIIGIPAITVRQGTLIKDTGGAPVSQTIDTGTDVEIKFIKLSSTRQTSEGFEGIDLTISEGFSDGTNSRAISFMSEEGVNTTNTGSRYANKGLTFIDSSLSTIAECDVSFGIGVDAGKFTLTWTTNDATASIIHFVTYGDGKETFSANVGTFTSNIVTGNQSIIGVGFKGEMSLFLTNNDDVVAPNTVSDGGMCVGHAMSPSKRNTITFLGRNAQGMTNKNNITQRTDLALRTLAPTGMSVGNTDADYDLVSFDADGFTLNVIDAPLTATQIFYAVLKGGNYDVGNFDQPISNGTQEITTGFKPIHTCFRSWNEVADIAIKKDVGEMKFTSSGADEENGIEEGGYWFESDMSAFPVDNDVNTYTSRAILLASGSSTINAEANYESSNDESFTLDWTVTDATAREVLYWTVGEAPTEGFTVDAILSALAEFEIDAVVVRNTFFDVDARLSALAEFTVDSRLAQRELFDIDAVVVRNELFDIDAVVVRNALFEIDAVIVRNTFFDIDARLSALAEFEIDSRLAQRELFTVDAVIVRNTFFDIDAVIVRNELFDIDAVVVDRFDKDFTVDGFPQQTQVFNFTVDGFIEQTPEKFFLVDAFIRDTFDEDFTVDSRIAVRELFTIDSRLSALEEFTVDARLSALDEFTIDGRIAQRELFEIDAVIVRNELFDVDARIAVRELFEVDAVIVRNELFDVDAVIVRNKLFDIDARIAQRELFTIDARLSALAEFTIDARLSALAEFTVDGRVAVRELFTVDGRIAVRELFTVDAELRPIQEFTIDAFVQVLNQEETFLVDARLKDLNSVLVIVDAFIQALNQEKTFLVDAFIEETFTETFLVDARLKGVQTETFSIDAFVQDTFDEDFLIDAFIRALDQEETFLVDAQLANIIAEVFLVDGLILKEQEETFNVDAKLAQRVEKDFTVDAKIAFRKDFTVDATLSPRELFTVDAFTKATQTKTFSVDSILTVAGQKVFTVDALVQNTFTETVQVDAHVRAVVQETFEIDAFIQDTFTEDFTIDARTEQLNSETFDVDAIIKALNTDKTFIVDTFTQETESPKLFTVDSFIQKTQTETTQVDAKVRDVIEETFIIDAFIQDTFTKTFSVDSILTVAGQEVFTVDGLTQTSDIDKTFTVEAKIQVVQIRPWQIDAIITTAQAETFTVDAQIFLPTLANFTIDGFLVQPVSILEFTVDAKIEESFTQEFTVDSILTDVGQKVFTVDGLTLGTQTKDFTVSAIIRNVNQETFDVDAFIKLSGDILCTVTGDVFVDDISSDTGWTVTQTTFPPQQVFVDDPSFPGVIRLQCFNSRLYTDAQAIKSLGFSLPSKEDLTWEFDHKHIAPCTGFSTNVLFSLTNSSTIDNDIDQGTLRYRTISSGSNTIARAELRDSSMNGIATITFTLTPNVTRFIRISITSGGTLLRLEVFSDSARTNLISSIPDVSIASVNSELLNFVQVSPIGGGGSSRQAREEFDNIRVNTSRCPSFSVDSVLRGEIEKNFTVDAQIVAINRFTIDAVILQPVSLLEFTVDAFIGTPELTFTIDALLKTQGKFTVDAVLKQLGDGLCTSLDLIHEDDITTDTGWTVTGTQIKIDDPSFPDLMRWDRLQSRLNGGVQQAVKALDISINNHRTDLVWELDHKHFLQQLIAFAGSGTLELTQTSTLTADAPNSNQGRISLRTFPTSQNFDETSARAEFSDGVNTVVTDAFELSLATHFYRITVFNDGTSLIFQSFSDSARTISEFISAPVDITSIAGKPLNFIQAGSLGGGGSARIVNEEFDNFFILSGACPRFDIDARVKALNQEVLFTVDALLAVHNLFNVDAVIKKPGEVLCSILSNIFEDDISSDTGWTVTGTQVLVDDPSFPNVIRAECLVNSNTVVQQAVKPLDVSMINTRDMIWDVDYTAFDPCFASNGNLFIALTETDDRISDNIGSHLRLRIFKSFANQFQVNVTSKSPTATVSTTSFFSGLSRPRDFFLRVSILNGGTDLRLEVFFDSDRTNLQFTDTVDQTSLSNAKLNFIQVSNLGGGTQSSNQLRGEVDKFLIIGDGCPRFDIDSLIIAQASEETFTVDAKLIRPPKTFTVDSILLATQTKVFRVDGISFVVPARLFTIDALLQPFIEFDVDAVLFQVKQTFDFTVDAFIQRTGEQLCDPSQITSFPDFTEDFSTYTNQTEADTAWVPQDISTAQVDITNDVLGVIQVSDTSNDANIFSNGLSPDSNEWVLRWKLVISSITFPAGGTCEGFFGWSAGGSVGGSSNQKSMGVQIRYGQDIGSSQFRANISNAINPIFPPQPGGNMSTPPDVGTFFFEMVRTGPLSSRTRIYSDATYTTVLEDISFSLGFFGSTPSGLGYKNNQLTNTGSIDYTIDDIQFWNGISDVSISSCPRFNVDAIIQIPTIDKEFIVDAVIKTLGENGTCNFFPGTNLAIDTGLEQFIGPIQPAHEVGVEQLIGQEVTLSNQQVRSVTILLRSSNFPNEITTNMPINAEIWSDVVVGNFGGETTEAVSDTVINAINTSGDLPSGDWTEVKFTFDINTTPFLTGDFVVGYRSLSSVNDPAGVGTALPVISNSNVIPGSAVHRKGANSLGGDLDEWGLLAGDQKDMVIQLEVVNGDEIILGVGKQCPVVDAVLENVPNKFEIDSIITDRFQRDFTIDTVLFPFPVPFTVDGILVGTQSPFTLDAVLVPEPKTFTVDGILTGAGQKVFLIDAVLQPFIEFEVDALVQALETKSPKFNLNALLVVEDREIDFTVDGSTKFFDQVAPFIVDAFVIFFPSRLPFVDGIIKELGALQPFTVDAFIQQLDFNFIRTIDALLQKSVGKNFLADALIETKDTEEDFTIDARLSTPSAPFLFTVDGLMLLENHRWQTDALLQKRVIKTFTLDGLIVALPQKLFLVDASTLGTIDETFIIDGLIEIEAQEPFLVDARILQINTVDFTVDARIFGVGLIQDFIVDASLVRVGEFLLDSFVQALGDGILGNGNNGSTNANNTTNPFISQTTDDNTITLPIGTLVGQRLRLPTAPVRVDDYTFVIHRAGTAGTPTGTLTGKIYKNSIGGTSISGSDLIATSDNVVSLASITTSSSGQNVQFTFTNPPEITVDDNVFIGFDIAGSNEQMFLHTESTGTAIAGGDVNIESTGTWGVDLGVDAVLTINIDTEPRQRASALMNAFVGRFIREIIGVDALIKSIGGVSPTPGPAEFTVDAKVAFVKEAGFTVDTQLIGSQDFTVSAFVGDTLFIVLEVESVIVENNSNEGVESVIVENNSDEGVESVIGQD